MTATALVALLVVSAAPKPTFETFAKSFPELKLPATFPAEGQPLAGADVMQFIIAPIANTVGPAPGPASPGKWALHALAREGQPERRAETLELMKDPKAEGALQFAAVGRLTLPGAVGLVVRRRLTLMMGAEDVTVLITYTPRGVFKDGLVLGDQGATEAGGSNTTSTLSPAFEAALQTEDTMPLHDIEGLEQLRSTSTSLWQVLGTGVCRQASSTWGSIEGEYRDAKSKEMLLLSASKAGVRAWYRAKDEAPPQKLTVVRDADQQHQVVVRFPKSPKEYVLTAPAGFATLSCKNPDGTVQQFARTR